MTVMLKPPTDHNPPHPPASAASLGYRKVKELVKKKAGENPFAMPSSVIKFDDPEFEAVSDKDRRRLSKAFYHRRRRELHDQQRKKEAN